MKRKWWKAYFFVVLALTIFGLVIPLFADEERKVAWWEWVYIPVYLVQIVGLFGFVFWRRIAAPTVWQFVFVAGVVYEIWELYSMATGPELPGDYAGFLASTIVGTLVLQIPLWIGLFLYGFRCRELWRGAT
jgi:hypothetical protein